MPWKGGSLDGQWGAHHCQSPVVVGPVGECTHTRLVYTSREVLLSVSNSTSDSGGFNEDFIFSYCVKCSGSKRLAFVEYGGSLILPPKGHLAMSGYNLGCDHWETHFDCH